MLIPYGDARTSWLLGSSVVVRNVCRSPMKLFGDFLVGRIGIILTDLKELKALFGAPPPVGLSFASFLESLIFIPSADFLMLFQVVYQCFLFADDALRLFSIRNGGAAPSERIGSLFVEQVSSI